MDTSFDFQHAVGHQIRRAHQLGKCTNGHPMFWVLAYFPNRLDFLTRSMAHYKRSYDGNSVNEPGADQVFHVVACLVDIVSVNLRIALLQLN